MKRILSQILIFLIPLSFCLGQAEKGKILVLVSEQNIEGPRTAWWATEIDLSATEATIASKLIESGFTVIDPTELSDVIKNEKAYRSVDLSPEKSVRMAKELSADYVLLGKAVASAGGNVPQSSMRSCFGNISAKLIRVKDRKILAYLEASGSSAHMDVVTGGKEALIQAASAIAPKIINALNK